MKATPAATVTTPPSNSAGTSVSPELLKPQQYNSEMLPNPHTWNSPDVTYVAPTSKAEGIIDVIFEGLIYVDVFDAC